MTRYFDLTVTVLVTIFFSEENLPRVHVKDISSAHLISYHPDKDLLPLVLANCNYTFEVGEGARIEYNYTNLERQLMDRFLFSKSTILGLNQVSLISETFVSVNKLWEYNAFFPAQGTLCSFSLRTAKLAENL